MLATPRHSFLTSLICTGFVVKNFGRFSAAVAGALTKLVTGALCSYDPMGAMHLLINLPE